MLCPKLSIRASEGGKGLVGECVVPQRSSQAKTVEAQGLGLAHDAPPAKPEAKGKHWRARITNLSL